jgi:Histidine phosphatase superfamily (branch 1)
MNITRITAIRHGETAWNVDTRIQGQLDIGLNAKGRWQAERAGAALADEQIDAVYSSDLWPNRMALPSKPTKPCVSADLASLRVKLLPRSKWRCPKNPTNGASACLIFHLMGENLCSHFEIVLRNA